MDDGVNLPFKEGQLAESKSFLKGYRGAWFKCKIKSFSKRNGKLGQILEYLDFPDEKLKWELLYQAPPHHEGDTKGKHRELMLRPPYPPMYNEKEMPHVSEISEVAVIVGDSWRVGDLVDWWTTNCYWSGTITHLLGPNKAKIDLPEPPRGEGSSYEVLFKDLRPSLDWSPELGWTMPTQEGSSRPSARLIKPTNHDRTAEDVQKSAGSLFPSPTPSNPAEPKSRTTETQTQMVSEKQERNSSQRSVDSSTRKTSRPAVAGSGQNRAEAKSRTVSEKQDCSSRKRSWVVADSGLHGTEAKSRTTELQTQTASQKQDKQKTNTGQGPVDTITKKLSLVVADSGQNGAELKRRTTEMQTKTVSVKKKDKQERRTRVVADSGKSITTEMQMGKTVSKNQDRQERSSSQGSGDSCPTETNQVVADSGLNGAEPAAEEEPNCDFPQKKHGATLNSNRSNTLEAVIMDLEEYVNKVKWLRKILQHGIVEGPQWAFMEP